MRNVTKFTRSIRAISPVISVLLMIAVAVVASLVAYAWVMGYMNFQTQNTGQAIQIPSYAPGADSGHMKIYVQNVGQGTVTIEKVYINDAMADDAPNSVLGQGETKELIVDLPGAMTWAAGEQVKIKVTTTSGTFMEVAGTGSSGPTGTTQYTITVTDTDNGDISPNTGSYSAGQSFTITPSSGYQIASITVNGNPVTVTTPSGQTYQFTVLSADNSITATYELIPATPTTLLSDGFEAAGGAWDDNWDVGGYTNWDQDYTENTGTYSANSDDGNEGYLISDNLDTNGALTITIDFWYMHQNTEETDLVLYYYDGSNTDFVANLGATTQNTWIQYQQTLTNSGTEAQYFLNNFRIIFYTNLQSWSGNNEQVYVDDVLIIKYS